MNSVALIWPISFYVCLDYTYRNVRHVLICLTNEKYFLLPQNEIEDIIGDLKQSEASRIELERNLEDAAVQYKNKMLLAMGNAEVCLLFIVDPSIKM